VAASAGSWSTIAGTVSTVAGAVSTVSAAVLNGATVEGSGFVEAGFVSRAAPLTGFASVDVARIWAAVGRASRPEPFGEALAAGRPFARFGAGVEAGFDTGGGTGRGGSSSIGSSRPRNRVGAAGVAG
jgi:hypothetical protein